jgi:hypothetical protein
VPVAVAPFAGDVSENAPGDPAGPIGVMYVWPPLL